MASKLCNISYGDKIPYQKKYILHHNESYISNQTEMRWKFIDDSSFQGIRIKYHDA